MAVTALAADLPATFASSLPSKCQKSVELKILEAVDFDSPNSIGLDYDLVALA
jgi:hypothetical protein